MVADALTPEDFEKDFDNFQVKLSSAAFFISCFILERKGLAIGAVSNHGVICVGNGECVLRAGSDRPSARAGSRFRRSAHGDKA